MGISVHRRQRDIGYENKKGRIGREGSFASYGQG